MRCLARTGRSRRSGGSGPAKLRGGRAGTARGKPSSSSLKSRRPGLLPRETETTSVSTLCFHHQDFRLWANGIPSKNPVSPLPNARAPPRTGCPPPVLHEATALPATALPRPAPHALCFPPRLHVGAASERQARGGESKAPSRGGKLVAVGRATEGSGAGTRVGPDLAAVPLAAAPITSLILLPSTSSISGGSSPSSPYHLGLRHHAISPPPLSLSTPTAIATYSNQPLRRRRVYIYISIRVS
jgi:hypothetical protein